MEATNKPHASTEINHPCICPSAGFCPAYRQNFNSRQHHICRGFDNDGNAVLDAGKRDGYRQLWLNQIKPGLGDQIAGITEAAGVSPCSRCSNRRERLNQLPAGHWLARLFRFLLSPLSRLKPAPPVVQLPEPSFAAFQISTAEVQPRKLVDTPEGEAFPVREFVPVHPIPRPPMWSDFIDTRPRRPRQQLNPLPKDQPAHLEPRGIIQPAHPIPPHVTRFAVGVTTAARKEYTLARSLESLVAAGFTGITVFAEPHAPLTGIQSARIVRRPTTIAPKLPQITPKPDDPESGLFGCWQNYLQTIADLLHLHAEAQAIVIAQDDITLAPRTREFLESDLWPAEQCGLVSLYTPRTHDRDTAVGCRRRGDHGKTGACLNVFPRHVAEQLIEHAITQDWRGRPRGKPPIIEPWLKKASDTATGDILKSLKLSAYSYTPSLVDHFAQHSAVGHGDNSGKRNARSALTGNVLEHWQKKKAFPPVRYSADGLRQYPRIPQHERPRITVVIPFVDAAEMTIDCLEHLAACNWPVDVLLVSNGSTAVSALDVAAGFENLVSDRFRVELVDWPKNRGFTAAINLGRDRALDAGQPLLILNNDCRVAPACLERLYRALCVDRRIAAVGPITADHGHQSIRKPRRLRQSGLGSSTPPALPAIDKQLTRTTASNETMLAFFCTLIRPSALREVGPLPADFADGLGADDVWCAAARRRRYRLELVHDAFAAHDHGATFRQLGLNRSQLAREALQKIKRPHQHHQPGKVPGPVASPAVSKLAVICCHFNPAGFVAPVRNLNRFLNQMQQQSGEVFLIHAVFPGRGEDGHAEADWRTIQAPNLQQVIVDDHDRQTLWQKERLLNLVAASVPAEFDALAWFDADIELPDDWLARTIDALRSHAVVQPWDRAYQEHPGGDRTKFEKPAVCSVAGDLKELRLDHVHPGFAWAMQRDAFDRCGGLLDTMITGGGDGLLASAFSGKPLSRGVWGRMSPQWQKRVQHYMQQAGQIVRGNVGFVRQPLIHMWHGSRENRQYLERWAFLTRGHFDPATDLELGENGLLQWSDSALRHKRNMIGEVAGYFRSRREDDSE